MLPVLFLTTGRCVLSPAIAPHLIYHAPPVRGCWAAILAYSEAMRTGAVSSPSRVIEAQATCTIAGTELGLMSWLPDLKARASKKCPCGIPPAQDMLNEGADTGFEALHMSPTRSPPWSCILR